MAVDHVLDTVAVSIVVVSSHADLPSQRRRLRADAARTAQIVVRFSPAEFTVVAEAAERDGLAMGAWIGELACRVARGDADGVPVEWADVVRVLIQRAAEEPGRGDLDELIDIAVARLS